MVNRLVYFVIGVITGAVASNYLSGFYAGMQVLEPAHEECPTNGEDGDDYGI